MNLSDQEILRTRWRRQLQELAVDTTARNDFGQGSLSRRLSHVTVQLVLLPADPEGNMLHIDDSFSSWLDEHRVVDLDGSPYTLPSIQRRTAHAIALIETYGDSWAEYFAVHRSGAIEIGAGTSGGWEGANGHNERMRTIALTPSVAHCVRCDASGFFAFCQVRGDVAANPVPRGPTDPGERTRPGPGCR